MEKELLYEGKAKKIFSIKENPKVYLQEFKDDATAFNGIKKEQFFGKGILNNNISTILFQYLANNGIPNHFIEKISETEMLVKPVNIIKAEVVCRNITAGSLVKRYGLTEGLELNPPIIEFYFKSDEHHDPLFTESHIYAMNLANESEIETIKSLTKQINNLLIKFFFNRGIKLVDFKLEFGRDENNSVILADEITPDTCRLWDMKSNEKLDKDRFRFDLGELLTGYKEIFERLKN